MGCKICKGSTQNIFDAKLLNKYHVKYFFCSDCKFLQTEDPYWLDEAYNNSLDALDTGVLQRNLYFSRKISVLLYFCFNRNGIFLDYGGGYGVFTRLMRDIGFDFYWFDPYSKNLFSRGFEYTGKTGKIDLITSFETFEHFVEPIVEFEKILSISDNILFSTELLPEVIPDPYNWWYYALPGGQHISFYSHTTLAYIARKYKLNLYSFGNCHLFGKKIQ